MSARIRETRGTSWRDPRVPGTRHWRSTSLSVGAGWALLGAVLWYGVVWGMFLGPLWVVAECWLLFLSAIITVTGVITGQGPPDGIYFRRSWLFWVFDLHLRP